jgi:serine/threonine protein phosphatase 1
MQVSRVRRCLRLPHNQRGRDFVVGDLHGHRALLERELERIGFDTGRDRLFSVGDLIDRGPDSLATLALLEEPWFHAVLGNHEMMLLHYLGYYGSRLHSRKAFVAGSGRWIVDAMSRHRKELRRLAEAVAGLPLAIHVAGDSPFNVTHGDLLPLEARGESLFAAQTVCIHLADDCTSSRRKVAEAVKAGFECLPFAERAVQLTDRPVGALPPTYVGHSPLPHVTVHDSYVYVDQGVASRSSALADGSPPTVLDHTQFSLWLRGAALALQSAGPRRQAPAAGVQERGAAARLAAA